MHMNYGQDSCSEDRHVQKNEKMTLRYHLWMESNIMGSVLPTGFFKYAISRFKDDIQAYGQKSRGNSGISMLIFNQHPSVSTDLLL